MISHICDRCERPILENETRYVARLEVFAAPDLPEITLEDLLRDHSADIRKLIGDCQAMSEEELMRDVYVEMKFVLCRRCQRAWLDNPLGRPSPGEAG